MPKNEKDIAIHSINPSGMGSNKRRWYPELISYIFWTLENPAIMASQHL